MNRALFCMVCTLLALVRPANAGGDAREVTVTDIRPTETGGFTLRFTEEEWGTRTLHIRYNAPRMRGVVSEREHLAALGLLRSQIAKGPAITLGHIGFDFSKVPGSASEYATDGLRIYGGIVYAWPTKRS